ncbi:hypothetical protein WDL1P1_00340 (plasmid) [Variovorax sp. WDL1]|nr:hypothetical protein [Variovorax sp. WDL1]KWT98213.1 hypothetical protein APY03_0884 [Variovorax sp. WDL1]PNG50291.1 hypothetical protein CHC06_05914 [Variovorax sp. B2]PNG51164.1 hypothetical protein CHC07_05820 [Variovorax sp. B4]VTV17376.1 hypothetical protein WDL1P1_00340 [Variovorax sp. WDL1]
MGLWRDMASSVRRNAMADREAKLGLLLADRAAGKPVRDEDVRLYRTVIEFDREYLNANAKLDAREEFSRQQRQAAFAAQQATQQEQWAQRRRQEREALREAVAAAREEQTEALQQTIAQHASSLKRMLEDDEELTQDEVLQAVFFAISLMAQEDAQRLGPLFGQVRRWVWDAHDEDGSFSSSDAADELDQDDFGDDLDYREAVAMRVVGDRVLEAALAPWDPLEKELLVLRYPNFDANLSEVGGPGYDGTLRGWFFHHDSKRNALGIYELDREQWEHRRLFSLPLPADLRDKFSAGSVFLHGAGKWLAVDPNQQFVLVGQQLYAFDGERFKKSGELQLSKLQIFESGKPAVVIRSDWRVEQQLAVIDGRPIWVGLVADSEKGAYVGVDLSTNRLMWQFPFLDQGGSCPVGGWQFAESSGSWWAVTSQEELMDESAPAGAEKGGFLGRLFKSQPKPAQPKTRFTYTLVERDAMTGSILRQMPLGPLSLMSPNVRLESDSRLSLWDGTTRRGFIDCSTLQYVEDRVEAEAQPLGTVGGGPLHVLQQTLRFHGGRLDHDGGLARSDVRLLPSSPH